MIEILLSLPMIPGCLLFMALSVVAGLTVYYVTYRLHTIRATDETIKEVRDITGNLFRVVGWLFTLLLSLTFSDVIGELSVTETAVEREVAAIVDVHHMLGRFSPETTRQTRSLLIEYTQSVIDDDWPALANDQLSRRTDGLLRQLNNSVLDLEPTGAAQETLHSLIIADMDLITDHRLSRLQQAREKISHVLIVVFLGYLVTMVYFGIYKPRRVVVALLSFYTLFVGIVLYLVVAVSDPFQGAMSVDPAPFEYAIEIMQSDDK